MCGRFAIASVIGFRERFSLDARAPEVHERYNIAPSQLVPVIVSESGSNAIAVMRWGISPPWHAGESRTLLINARAETLAEKPVFSSLLEKNRCLVPATGYYEWKKSGINRNPWYITAEDRSLLAFAGLFSRGEGARPDSCTIVTTSANEQVTPLHERMPAILSRNDEQTWLSDRPIPADECRDLLCPAPSGLLEAYRVGRSVNSPMQEGPELIRPLGEQKTFG